MAVARDLAAAGATVVVHDPKVLPVVAEQAPEVQCCDDLAAALDGARLLLHLTEWPDCRQVDPAFLVGRPTAAHLIDARASLDHARWSAAGWQTQILGVAPHPAA